MNAFGNMFLLLWPIAALVVFALLPSKRDAAIFCFVAAWLFLPFGGYSLPGLPDFTKVTAASLSVCLGACLFDLRRVLAYRIRWFDTPMILWCVSPFVSSIVNGLGTYDACSAMIETILTWGVPYFVGRVYLSDLGGLRKLAVAILVGGLAYVPLVLIESRFSAQLHGWVYGIPARANYEQVDFFGPLRWKPSVFMDSALGLTLFMASAALIGLWLTVFRSRPRNVLGVPVVWSTPVLVFSAILGKSLGGTFLLAVGAMSCVVIRKLRTPLPVLFLLLVAPTYIILRTYDLWHLDSVVAFIRADVSARRADSLAFRLANEDILMEKAFQRPYLGWGRWGRARVHDDTGRDVSVTDGLWIIAFGNGGYLALGSLYFMLLLPPALLLRRQPRRFWYRRDCAPAVALGVVLTLYSIDTLVNSMLHPLLVCAAGGLISLPHVEKGLVKSARARDAGVTAGPIQVSAVNLAGRRTALNESPE